MKERRLLGKVHVGDRGSHLLASPQHDKEGCMIFMFKLYEFACVLEQDASHCCSAESQSCTFMSEREEEERTSQP